MKKYFKELLSKVNFKKAFNKRGIICLSILLTLCIISKFFIDNINHTTTTNVPSKLTNEYSTDSEYQSSNIPDIQNNYKYNTHNEENLLTDSVNSITEGGCVIPSLPKEPDPTIPSIKENDFITTLTNPISTFSSDVDTASYITFRQMVKNGYTLNNMQQTNFRTEEFLNYFTYNYSAPKDNETFGLTTEVGQCPWNNDNYLVRIGIKASETKQSIQKPLNLVFLIDSSGSMSTTDKLPLLKESLTKLLPKLNKNDIISIVTYSGESKIVLDSIHGNETSKISSAINELQASGCTNGGVGITTAYKIAQKNYNKGYNNRVLLATDGDLNMGITSETELKELISEEKSNGIYLSVLGFGEQHYNDSIMETLADNGNGNYSIIDSDKQAKKVLIDEFNGTFNTVATDVKFQVTFNPKAINKYRLIGYENRTLDTKDFNNDTKDAGDIGTGQTITALYEITPQKQNNNLLYNLFKNNKKDSITLNIRYKDSYNSSSKKITHSIDCIPSNNLSDDFRFVSSITELCMLLNNSKYKENISLDNILNQLRDLPLNSEDKKEFYNLVEQLSKNNGLPEYDVMPIN